MSLHSITGGAFLHKAVAWIAALMLVPTGSKAEVLETGKQENAREIREGAHATLAARRAEQSVILAVASQADQIQRPRPDLAGLRVKLPTSPAIYLVDPEGYRRWIPNPATYNNLFRDWEGVIADINIDEISERPALSNEAMLAKTSDNPAVYLVSNGVKRWITSPAVMDKYHFNWAAIKILPASVLEAIPKAANWD